MLWMIDVFLDRRLKQDDARGVGQGVRDNVITRTRLRIVLEHDTMATINSGGGEFQITPFCRTEWDKLNHPLEIFGEHVKEYVRPPQPAPLPAGISRTRNHVAPNPIKQPLAQQNHVIPKQNGSAATAKQRHLEEENPAELPDSSALLARQIDNFIAAAQESQENGLAVANPQNPVQAYHPHGLYHPGVHDRN